jgi:hypothetical protein
VVRGGKEGKKKRKGRELGRSWAKEKRREEMMRVWGDFWDFEFLNFCFKKTKHTIKQNKSKGMNVSNIW